MASLMTDCHDVAAPRGDAGARGPRACCPVSGVDRNAEKAQLLALGHGGRKDRLLGARNGNQDWEATEG